MFRLRDVQAFKRPSERNQGSLYQAVKTNIVDAENGWILRSNDLAALAHDAEHGWVNVWLENTLNRVSRNTLLVSIATAHFYCYFTRKDPCSRLLSITPILPDAFATGNPVPIVSIRSGYQKFRIDS